MRKNLLLSTLTCLLAVTTYAQQIKNVDVVDAQGKPIQGSVEICEGGLVRLQFTATGFCAGTTYRLDVIDPGNATPVNSATVTGSPGSVLLDSGPGNNRLVRITSIAPAGCNDPEKSGSTNPVKFIRFSADVVQVTGANASQTTGTKGSDIKLDLQNGDVLTYAAPRFWTIIVNACPGTNAVLLSLSSVNGVAFKAVENVSPWVLFGNEMFTRLWTIHDPTWGINSTYTTGFPVGVYSLALSLRDQQGTPLTAYPKLRTAQGNVVGSKTISFEIKAPSPPRIGVIEPELTVRAWPNPTTDRLTVEIPAFEAEAFSMRLIDMEGRPVYEKAAVTTSANHQEEVSMSQHPTGTYLLQVNTPQGMRVAKIMKTGY